MNEMVRETHGVIVSPGKSQDPTFPTESVKGRFYFPFTIVNNLNSSNLGSTCS